MLQINVDISILMCLPTDSTVICTADRRVAIITAYHSSCSGISDIIRLLVHHTVTVSASLNVQFGTFLKQAHCASVGKIYFAPGDKRWGTLFVLCGVMSKLEFLLLANALLYTARTTANKQAPAKSTQVSAGQCNH